MPSCDVLFIVYFAILISPLFFYFFKSRRKQFFCSFAFLQKVAERVYCLFHFLHFCPVAPFWVFGVWACFVCFAVCVCVCPCGLVFCPCFACFVFGRVFGRFVCFVRLRACFGACLPCVVLQVKTKKTATPSPVWVLVCAVCLLARGLVLFNYNFIFKAVAIFRTCSACSCVLACCITKR